MTTENLDHKTTAEEEAVNLVKEIRKLAANDRENLVNAIASCIIDGVLTDEVWNIANATAQYHNTHKDALEAPHKPPAPKMPQLEYAV